MPKKIYDVVPPKVAHAVEHMVKSQGDGKHKRKPTHRGKTVHHKKQKSPLGRKVLVGGGVIVALLLVLVFFKLAKADIQIWPKLEEISLQETVIANTSATAVDAVAKVVPLRVVVQEESDQQVFDATGSSSTDTKASGTIRIYNKVTPFSPLTLKPGTHFLSDSGKFFVSLSKVTIPAATKNGPGSIEIKVQAEEAGSDYNIKPSKFSVPKLSGTAYYYNISAESTAAMTGGSLGNVKRVTKDDIERAADSLTKNLFTQAEDNLKNKLSAGEMLVEGALLKEVVSAESDVAPETAANTFNESAKVKVSALVLQIEDLKQIAKNKITSQLSSSHVLLEKSLSIQQSPTTFDVAAGKANLNTQFSAKTYSAIDSDTLRNLVQRKSSDQIQEIINSTYQDKISQLKVNLWPFWVKKAPSQNRINIDLMFE